MATSTRPLHGIRFFACSLVWGILEKQSQKNLKVQPPCKVGPKTSYKYGLKTPLIQWIFQVPVKGGRDYITPYKAIYKWYILPLGGLYATYHLLGEPETTIDL